MCSSKASKDDPHRPRALEDASKIMEILRQRRETHFQRKPTILSLISAPEI
jgi:hypothetical protein